MPCYPTATEFVSHIVPVRHVTDDRGAGRSASHLRITDLCRDERTGGAQQIAYPLEHVELCALCIDLDEIGDESGFLNNVIQTATCHRHLGDWDLLSVLGIHARVEDGIESCVAGAVIIQLDRSITRPQRDALNLGIRRTGEIAKE